MSGRTPPRSRGEPLVWVVPTESGVLVIADPSSVRALSVSEATTTLLWAAHANPGILQERMTLGTNVGLASPLSAGGYQATRESADGQVALQRILEGIQRGELVALETPSSSQITQAELDMLEARRRQRSIPAPPPAYRPPPPEVPLHAYPLRIIDDTGAPVSGVRLKLEIDGTPRMPVTDGDGRAVAEWFSTAPAQVRVLNQSDLQQKLEPQFALPRARDLPTGPNVFEFRIDSPFREIAAPPDQETTIILSRGRQPHWIRILVRDEQGTPLGERRYQLVLPDGNTVEGTTAADGSIAADFEVTGDCTLTLLEDEPRESADSQPSPDPVQPLTTPAAPPPLAVVSDELWVRHTFVDAITGAPVADVSWLVRSSAGAVVASGVTGDDGMLFCSVDEPGRYRIEYDEPPDAPLVVGDAPSYGDEVYA